ncbi:MAG: DEAD/DEAH box helicase [Sedimentisphaerales bacterium]|nr:DEAD/DEAH box helicase [Sedimentisphaerales bacterium]
MTKSESVAAEVTFESLNLSAKVLKAIAAVGYETPTTIQALTIPPLLEGRDLMGQAQTGTGKTAAFALPILSKINAKSKSPQAIVLAPTRELAIQVAEAFQTYAKFIPGFSIAPIYGGADYRGQLNQLKRGVNVVVGTPGRVMDHMRRGSLMLDEIEYLVLDEADEMLKMGFIDDITWILEQTPAERQTALFSATMPREIITIAKKYMRDPQEIIIKAKTSTADNIRQRYWNVSGLHKLDALTRILEAEEIDGMIIFVRTKTETIALEEKLQARGFSCGAINGDMSQKNREMIIERLKNGKVDILIATDVAARGLDVDRISHVVNYDIPYDSESYIHRVGRTGRAGRKGEAILFVAPRERRMLSMIEKATRQKIEPMELPTTAVINDKRIARFQQKITDAIASGECDQFTGLLEQYCQNHNVPAIEVAAALTMLMHKKKPLLLKAPDKEVMEKRGFDTSGKYGDLKVCKPGKGMEYFVIEVGRGQGATPGLIIDTLAETAAIDRKHIGRISIMADYSCVELPEGMPDETREQLVQSEINGHKLNLVKLEKSGYTPSRRDTNFDPEKRVRKSDFRPGNKSGGRSFGQGSKGGKGKSSSFKKKSYK